MENKLKQLETLKVDSPRIFKETSDINNTKCRNPLLINFIGLFRKLIPLKEPAAVKRRLSGEEMLAINDQLQTNKNSVRNTVKSLNGIEMAITGKDSSE